MELEGGDNMYSIGDSEALLGEIEEFLTGERHEREPDRMLATVLFTDICGSTERAAADGRPLLARTCSSATTRCSGARSTATAAARSSTPATASWPPSTGPPGRSAAPPTWPTSVASIGLQVRAGLHTGELR